MSEITQYQMGAPIQQTGVQVQGPSSSIISMVNYANELDAAYEFACKIDKTPFMPKHFKGKPEDAAVAMLYAAPLGLLPVAALKSIYVVHGTPALYAEAMLSIALAHGHQIERVHATETSVKFRCRRRGSQNWQEVEWTIQRAQKAGYTSNAKYRENPIGMLTEKCKAEAARLVAADALAGMPAGEDVELGDYDDSPAFSVEPESSAPAPAESKRTVKRKPRGKAPEPQAPDLPPTPAPEPEADDEQGAEEGAPVMSDRAQWVQAGQLMSDLGIEEKADKAREMRDWATGQGITRDLPSMAALTRDECAAFTDYLQSLATGQPAVLEEPEDAA